MDLWYSNNLCYTMYVGSSDARKWHYIHDHELEGYLICGQRRWKSDGAIFQA